MNATNTPLQKEEGFQNMKKYIFTLYIILCALTMQAQHQVASFLMNMGLIESRLRTFYQRMSILMMIR